MVELRAQERTSIDCLACFTLTCARHSPLPSAELYRPNRRSRPLSCSTHYVAIGFDLAFNDFKTTKALPPGTREEIGMRVAVSIYKFKVCELLTITNTREPELPQATRAVFSNSESDPRQHRQVTSDFGTLPPDQH